MCTEERMDDEGLNNSEGDLLLERSVSHGYLKKMEQLNKTRSTNRQTGHDPLFPTPVTSSLFLAASSLPYL